VGAKGLEPLTPSV